MPLPQSLLAYSDCRELFDKALASDNGLKITSETKGKAIHLRQRLMKFRALDRTQNAKIYVPGDPLFGKSEYDRVSCALEDNALILKVGSAADYQVEAL